MARMFIAALVLACAAPEVAGASSTLTNLRQKGNSFIKRLDFTQKLRICNAYPFTSALAIYLNSNMQLSTSPLPYKQCEEYTPELHAGDEIVFKVGDESTGSFTISDLPSADATLLLVIQRHDTESTAVTFNSHVFTSMGSSQVAILDTYKGPEKSALHITDMAQTKQGIAKRDETLLFNSVVALDSGAYEVSLKSDAPKPVTRSESEFVAVPGTPYVVMRVGVAAKEGPSYPEEIVVYPRSSKAELGAAPRMASFGAAAILALFSALLAF
jgi:hypothetical protein